MKQYTRRDVLATVASASAAISVGAIAHPAIGKLAQRKVSEDGQPNIIFILVDDQAYGDLGCMGNKKLPSPNIDRLFHESVWFPNFYVCPLCSPTRSTLMTGRYNYRGGIIDTSTGLSMMRPDELTIAQILRTAGYRTGIFGKWHLGDHYPLRPIDRGFDESLVNKDAIVAGISNPPSNSFFDPILYQNEKPVKTKGYITDITFNTVIDFVERNKDRPFFVYLPTNVVHEPLAVDKRYSDPFKAMGFDDYTATLYGEVVNLDENIGRLRAKLQELSLAKNTVLIYASDNGPAGPPRYNAGLRAGKGAIYEGGIKEPFFVHWVDKLSAGSRCEQIAAHIDVLPTVLEMCGVALPRDLHLDGRSLLPLMKGRSADWSERTLFFQQSRADQAHRVYSDEPRRFTNCAARGQKYKIVMADPDPGEIYVKPVTFEATELYDIENDPGEKNNVAHEYPEIVRKMRAEYEAWFLDVSMGISPPVRIVIGSTYENPVKLSSQDLRGVRSARGPHTLRAAQTQAEKKEPLGFGYWAIEVVREAQYRITMQFEPVTVLDDKCSWHFPLNAGEAFLRIGEVEKSQLIEEGSTSATFDVKLRPGKQFLNASMTGQREGGVEVSPFFAIVECLGIGRV